MYWFRSITRNSIRGGFEIFSYYYSTWSLLLSCAWQRAKLCNEFRILKTQNFDGKVKLKIFRIILLEGWGVLNWFIRKQQGLSLCDKDVSNQETFLNQLNFSQLRCRRQATSTTTDIGIYKVPRQNFCWIIYVLWYLEICKTECFSLGLQLW